MTTLAKIEANRSNCKRSTGPRSANGKAVAKLNAVAHGLRSLSPVLPGESPKDWTDHRAGVVAALAPVGTLEAELAERAALLLWRLRRVVRYETEVASAGINEAVGQVRGEKDDENPLSFILPGRRRNPRTCFQVQQELENARECATGFAKTSEQLRQLPTLPANQRFDGGEAYSLLREVGAYTPGGDEEYFDIEDHEFLGQIGVPADWREDADWWDGWNAGIIRAGVKIIAEASGMTEAGLIEWAVKESARISAVERRKALKLEAELARVTADHADAEREARGRSLLPTAEVADKVMRYESHLNKQLTQTLHMLERLRAIRDGNPPTPPAAIDVTVETGN